jgi:hypothetical protein
VSLCAAGYGRSLTALCQDEESRLLFDDPNNLHYGSFSDQPINGQEDAVEIQRENEALQRVVAKTSEYVADTIASSRRDPKREA